MIYRILLIAFMAILCACETTTPSKIKRSPAESAVIEGRVSVESSRLEALEESEDREQFRFQVRHNPGRCDAPLYEVYLKGRWIRAYFNLEKTTLRGKLEQLAQRTDISSVLWVQGRLTDAVKLSEKRVAWPIVDLFSIEDSTPTSPVSQKRISRPCVGVSASADRSIPPHIGG